ncbi:MAG: glycosyltransferase [Bacteroidetes bacterium]|nr:glycosyltransferase [Bacteroidota bacterium]
MADGGARKSIRFLFVGDPRFDRRIRNLVSLFVRAGWRIELFYGSVTPTEGTLDGVSAMVHIKPSAPSGPRFFFSYDRLLTTYLRNAPPVDVTVVSDLFGLRAAARTKPGKSLLVYDAREVYTQLPAVEGSQLKQWFWKQWERRGLGQTDLVVTTAPLDGDVIKAVHGTLPPTVVLKNMPSEADMDSRSIDLRSALGIGRDRALLVYVGGLQQGRGLVTTIEALQQIPEADLVLIGTGAFTDTLREASARAGLASRTHFYGPAHAADVLPLLRSADVGISLIERTSGSYRLALPSKVFEYLHAGLPVVSSPLEQVQMCIGEQPYLFYADENDLAAVVRAIRNALDASTASGMRERIASDARAHYTFEHDAVTLLEQIERMTSHEPPVA